MSLNSRNFSMRGLRTFCVAARHSTLKQAADELFITPSAVSHQLKKLEGELGLPLFERQGRTLVLTQAGNSLYEGASEAMLKAETAVASVRARYAHPALRVSVQPFFASELLMPRLNDFAARHPDISVDIDASDDSTQVHPASADVLIRLFREPPEQFITRKLFPLTLVPACSPGLQERLGDQPLNESTPFPLVVHSGRPGAWKNWATGCGIRLPENNALVRLDSMAAVVQAAERGLGVALVPLQLTATAFSDGRLVQLFDHALETADAYYVVSREDSEGRKDISQFIEWVFATLG